MATTKALELGQFGTDLTVDDSTGAVTIANDVTVNAATSTGIDDNADQTVITIGSDESVTLAGTLNVNASSTGQTPPTAANLIVADSTANNGMAVLSGNTSIGSYTFGDTDDAFVGGFRYRHADDELDVYSANSLAFTFGDTFIRTLRGTIKGPSTMILDPSPHDPDTDGTSSGTVRIYGDLIVDGNTTTINSTTLTVDDLNIVLASGAADSATADGAGITIDGANATLTWDDSAGRMVFNKGLNVENIIRSQRTNYAKLELNSTAQTSDNWILENSNGKFVITENHSGSSVGSWLYVTPGGNVGIGSVSSPNQSLVVDHIGHGVGFGYVSSIPDAPGGVYSTAGGSTYPFNEYGNLILKTRTDYNVYDIIMMTASTNGSAEIRMVIKDNGRVGVGGITDPVQDFEVEGSIGTNQVRHSIRPSLNLDFANSKQLDPRITYYRDSIATYYDSKGVLRYANANEPRFDHDPVTGESKGLLIEEGRTNLYKNSTLGKNWGPVNAFVKLNDAVSPDGRMNAHTFVEDTTNGQHYLTMGGSYPIVSGSIYTFSFYAKSDGLTRISWTTGGGFPYSYARFELSGSGSNSLTNLADGAWSITPVGNGWYYCTVTLTANSTTNASFYLDLRTLNSGTGDGISGVHIYGVQVEQGGFATSYIPSDTRFTSRSSVATYYDETGILRTAPANSPRYGYKYDGRKWVETGLILENAATNRIHYSNWLTNQQTGTTFTPNYATSPTGANDANRLTWSAGTANQNWVKALDANGVHTVSGYFKYVSGGTVIDFTLFAYQSGNSGFRGVRLTYVNATTLTLSNAIPSIPADSYGSEYVGNGWHRVWFTTTLANSVGNGYSEYNINRESVPDVSSASEWLWFGGQMEAGSIATSYIDVGPQPFNVVIAWPNGGVTRSADVASSVAYTRAEESPYIDNLNWYNDTEFSVYADASVIDSSYANQPIVTLEETNPSRYLTLGINTGGGTDAFRSWQINYQGNTDLLTTLSNVGLADGVSVKSAYAIAENDFAHYSDTVSTLDTSVVMPNPSRLVIGDYFYGHMSGHIKKISYYDQRLSNAELQALTENN